MIWLRCEHCGYSRETNYVEDLIECPVCGEPLIIDNDNEERDNKIADKIEDNKLADMRRTMEYYGILRTWDLIEQLKNPYERIKNRDLFFRAGGFAPKSDLGI